MSHSLGYGTSSGDLNTGGNLSEASFFEVLFGLEFGPTALPEFHRFLPYACCDFASILQISCYFLGGFEKKAYFCGRIKRLK